MQAVAQGGRRQDPFWRRVRDGELTFERLFCFVHARAKRRQELHGDDGRYPQRLAYQAVQQALGVGVAELQGDEEVRVEDRHATVPLSLARAWPRGRPRSAP